MTRASSIPRVLPNAPVRTAAEAIDRSAIGITTVIDVAGRLIGTVTDGDIRRAMLDGLELDHPVRELLVRKRGAAYERPVTAGVGASDAELLALMRSRGVRQVPIVDASGRPVRIATVDALIAAAVPHAGEAPASTDGVHARRAGRDAPTTAVIMAGGKGTRLRPLTQHTPKPMLDVAGRPLLEHTIERLRGAGIDRICISTNYLADLIIDHFGNGAGLGVSISYLREDAPLGTAGCLGLLDPIPGGPVLVLNGDILTSVDFDAMRRFHDDNAAGLTVAVRNHKISVPFGVAECEGVAIRSLVEKPTYSVLVNAGIYLIEPALLRAIPRGASGPARFDMTELIDAARSPGAGFTAGPVCAFAVREYWLDIGQPGDYERAQREGPEVVVRPSLDQHRAAG